MKFQVKYMKTDLYFHRDGLVFLNESFLICKGRISKFKPLFFGFLYDKVISIPTTKTIPFSTVIKYKKPSWIRPTHLIIYRLPNGNNCHVIFTIKKDNNNNVNRFFSSRLQEYLLAVKSLT